MNTRVVQRWRERVGSYRPAGEPFDPCAHEVVAIPDDTTAKRFVVEHHYSSSYPAARWRFGLYERGALVGVAVYSVPMRAEVLRPDTTEAPPSPDALVEEVGRVVAETVRLRRSIAIADEAYRVRGDLCDAMRGRIADLEALASGPRGDL